MGITEELFRLGQAARRLNDGSDRLDRSLAGLAAQVDDMVAHIERRNQIATAILGTLEPRE